MCCPSSKMPTLSLQHLEKLIQLNQQRSSDMAETKCFRQVSFVTMKMRSPTSRLALVSNVSSIFFAAETRGNYHSFLTQKGRGMFDSSDCRKREANRIIIVSTVHLVRIFNSHVRDRTDISGIWRKARISKPASQPHLPKAHRKRSRPTLSLDKSGTAKKSEGELVPAHL